MPAPTAPAFVGSAACADCHEAEHAAWAGSDHAAAWTAPSEAAVLGDFGDVVFEHGGMTTRFFREGDGWFIETEGPDGVRRPYEVVGVAGRDPLQQYLISPAPGRTQAYDIAWDVDGARWYPVFPGPPPPPGDGFHWSGPYKSWEARCAECHATGYTRNYDPRTRSYAPELVETGVGCESCHGPGGAHVAWAADPEAAPGPALAVDLSDRAGAGTESCFACHSRREAWQDGLPPAGTPYHDAYALSLLREGLYHADGAILDEVFETGSFLQSKMHARGVGCADCHDPHAGQRVAQGNAVCAQCHSPAGNPRFPALVPALYDDPSHHFHPAGSPGAECRACHMAPRTYMGIDVRYDHAFRIPRPDLAAETGAPDACTYCHADRDPVWAAAEIAKRFPDPKNRGPHFSTTLAAARWSPATQGEALLALAEDPARPGILRATALELVGQAADPALSARAQPLLADPDPLVRAGAAAAQRGVPPAERAAALAPTLTDPVRSVRIAAARAALDAVGPNPPPALVAALGDWRDGLSASADFPETHLQIGGAALAGRNWDLALAAFGEATTLDPQLVDAWSMQVRLLDALGRPAEAAAVLAAARAANPGAPALEGLR